MDWQRWLLRKKLQSEEKLLVRQREVLLGWIETHGILPSETVVVASSYDVTTFRFSDGKWEKYRLFDAEKPPATPCRFVLCVTGTFFEVKHNLGFSGENWGTIFSSDIFEVWESRSFYEERDRPLPLRLGLSKEEKIWMVGEVRRMMGEALNEKVPTLSLDPLGRLGERQDLDVAVWSKGRIRASVIMTDLSCQEALEIGAKRATWDQRFTPLTKEELPEARIEITFMSDLLFPVLESDFTKNQIDATKGYIATLASKKKHGWYLAAVHNVVSFPHLRNMLFRLATEKAGVTREEVGHCFFGQFPTFDWIETDDGIMTLSGPTEEVFPYTVSDEEVRSLLDGAVAWFCHMQESSGNIPAKISQKGVIKKVSLPVLGCTGHALASYGQTFSHGPALEAAEKAWQYIKRSLDTQSQKTVNNQYYYTLVYFLRLSCILGKVAEPHLVENLVEARASFHNDPILWLQTLSLLVDYERSGQVQYRDILREEVRKAQDQFKKRRELPREQLAAYPELIAVCHGLWRLTGEEQWKDQALEMAAWYRGKQRADGSFPSVPGSRYTYTRGTGKLFEVLACFPEENREILEKTFLWLQNMQYTHRNTFFMSQEEQKQLVGGFRHDVFNREVWIDASVHVILGATRFLARKKE